MNNLLMHLPVLPTRLPVVPAVRLLRAGEDAALATLLAAAFEEPWDLARVHAELVDDPTVEAIYVIADGDRLLATASARFMPDAWPHDGYLHWVASHPDARGRGLGRDVVVAVLRRFVEAGCRGSVLETEDQRLAALKTYLRLGYVPRYRDADADEFAEQERRWSAILARLLASPIG